MIKAAGTLIDPDAVLYAYWTSGNLVVGIGTKDLLFTGDEAREMWIALGGEEPPEMGKWKED